MISRYIYLNQDETQYVFDVDFAECGVVRTFHADHMAYDVAIVRSEFYENPGLDYILTPTSFNLNTRHLTISDCFHSIHSNIIGQLLFQMTLP